MKSRLDDSLMPRVITVEEKGIERRLEEVSWKNVLDLENIIECISFISNIERGNLQRTNNVAQPE